MGRGLTAEQVSVISMAVGKAVKEQFDTTAKVLSALVERLGVLEERGDALAKALVLNSA